MDVEEWGNKFLQEPLKKFYKLKGGLVQELSENEFDKDGFYDMLIFDEIKTYTIPKDDYIHYFIINSLDDINICKKYLEI